MKLVANLDLFGRRPLTEQFECAKRSGFAGVRATFPDQDFVALNDIAKQTNVPVISVDLFQGWQIAHETVFESEWEKAADFLHDAVIAANNQEIPTLSLCLGSGVDFGDRTLDRTEGLRLSLDRALGRLDPSEFGVRVLIRPDINDVFFHCGDTIEEVSDLMIAYLDWFHHPCLGFDVDIGVCAMYGNPSLVISKLGSRVRQLTISPYNSIHQRLCNIQKADFEWESIRRALAAIGFDGAVVLSQRGSDEKQLFDDRCFLEEKLGL
ncbi:MAG: sugar phosphate isomerase/epimerase family protein [Pirellula sp.]